MTKLKAGDVDGIPVLCEKCGTIIIKDTEEEADEVAELHNESRHGGDGVAVVVTGEYDVSTSEVGNTMEFVQNIMEAVR